MSRNRMQKISIEVVYVTSCVYFIFFVGID
jgi:hypothetical protein